MTNKEWDIIAIINKTDLYGLLNIMLKELGEEDSVTETLNDIKSACNECLDDDVCELTLISLGGGDVLKLEGTIKQIEAFEAERKERNAAMFPRGMSFKSTRDLAFKHGLSIKKVTLNNKEEK
jgi:hypothetical protein